MKFWGPPSPGGTAAATAEEFSAAASPHPITPRDSISRSESPLTPIKNYELALFRWVCRLIWN